ncbi:sulfatase [Balneolales bacterium ANBcel1]|nr:sulfatase [Balneolales bacterium ANBcel1]
MKKHILVTTGMASLLTLPAEGLSKNSCQDAPPNFVFILTDDLGYGDIGVYGAQDIHTPNIDRMAEEGILFTDFYATSPVCSPSRASLLTGRYAQRMGVNAVFFPESLTGMPVDELTKAELLAKQDYATAIIGKWHLGHMHRYLPLQRGFDEYFGMPYSNDMASAVYMRGNDVEKHEVDQRYSTRRFTEEALDFIERNREQPFYLLLSHTMPHVPLYASEDFLGTSERGLYGDVVQELDWSVGEILDKLEAENLHENTLVVFTSDNGPWLVMRDHGGSAGSLREGKFYTFEGGMRVPTVAMWPGTIPENTVYEGMANMMDWFPTFAHLAGAEVPDSIVLDGEDISPVLFDQGERTGNDFLFMEYGELQGYRYENWKIKLEYEGFPGAWYRHNVAPHPLLLIDLDTDPSERINLAEEYPERVEWMLEKMDSAYQSLGPLPPSITTTVSPDESHLEYLREEYGGDFYIIED